jgi:hypothetical protein
MNQTTNYPNITFRYKNKKQKNGFVTPIGISLLAILEKPKTK